MDQQCNNTGTSEMIMEQIIWPIVLLSKHTKPKTTA